MITVPLDEAYFEWLYSQVGTVKLRRSSQTYWELFKILFKKEFIWLVPNDDNRAEDGKSLRYEFVKDLELDHVDRDWMELNCSFLEMLIALSRRYAFEIEGDQRDCFWHILHNLDLDIYADNIDIPKRKINDRLDAVIWRTYRRDGYGGLFPLKRPHEDQREVEIWYQLSAYLIENE